MRPKNLSVLFLVLITGVLDNFVNCSSHNNEENDRGDNPRTRRRRITRNLNSSSTSTVTTRAQSRNSTAFASPQNQVSTENVGVVQNQVSTDNTASTQGAPVIEATFDSLFETFGSTNQQLDLPLAPLEIPFTQVDPSQNNDRNLSGSQGPASIPLTRQYAETPEDVYGFNLGDSQNFLETHRWDPRPPQIMLPQRARRLGISPPLPGSVSLVSMPTQLDPPQVSAADSHRVSSPSSDQPTLRRCNAMGPLSDPYLDSMFEYSYGRAGTNVKPGNSLFNSFFSTAFDVSDTVLLPFVQGASVETVPGFETSFYGEYIDPDSGTRRYVPLPVQLRQYELSDEGEDEGEEGGGGEEEEEKEEETKNDVESDSDETRLESSQEYVPQPSDIFPAQSYKSPSKRRLREENIPVCPGAPFIASDARHLHTPIILPRKRIRLDSCQRAMRRFDREMASESRVAQLHASFPAQNHLLENVAEMNSCFPLEPKHLCAFEVRFDLFLDLIKNCPAKYFAPALALSLQYDQDLPKFVELVYSHKPDYVSIKETNISLHKLLFSLGLTMPFFSRSAFEFLTSPVNAAFFLPHRQNHNHYKGKFAYHLLAQILSDHRMQNRNSQNTDVETRAMDNPMRDWLLNFDYYEAINSLHQDRLFAEMNLYTLPRTFLSFRSPQQYYNAMYKLVKTACDETGRCFETICKSAGNRLLLSEALRHGDLDMVKMLFKLYEFESNTSSKVAPRRNSVHVEVKHLNSGKFCSVKLHFDHKSLTQILPLGR